MEQTRARFEIWGISREGVGGGGGGGVTRFRYSVYPILCLLHTHYLAFGKIGNRIEYDIFKANRFCLVADITKRKPLLLLWLRTLNGQQSASRSNPLHA